MEFNGMVPLPHFFKERMRKRLGGEYADFEASLAEDAPVSFRLNPAKWRGALTEERVPWCSTGYYLADRPLFTADPWFHGGVYYVQEPASMFLEQAFRALDLPRPALVLDLCGAPGGKTTHLLSLLNPGDLVVANEVIRSRAAILLENILKWGHPNVLVTNSDPEDFGRMGNTFDLIVTDAPCSGEGLFRKDRGSVGEWSPGNAEHCASRQKRILSEAWKCLKPGGYLLYSTCTWNPAENEENIDWLISRSEAVPVEVETKPEWHIETIRYRNVVGYQFLPHLTKGEGFFLAVVRKPGIPDRGSLPGHPTRFFVPVQKSIASALGAWTDPIYPGTFLSKDDIYMVFPTAWLPVLAFLEKNVRVLQPGTPVATAMKEQFIPHPALAHSLILNRRAFSVASPGLADAVRYLRKESLSPEYGEKGWVLVSYREIPLGWLKNLGNRTNNYFPGERRIRMQIAAVPVPWHEKSV